MNWQAFALSLRLAALTSLLLLLLGMPIAAWIAFSRARWKFLIEAVVLSSLGGLIGIVIGIGTSQLVSLKTGWPILVSPTSVVVAVVFSAAVGMFFGYYPARKAALLDPIEALRYE